MIRELKHFEFTCEHCQRDDQESQWIGGAKKYPELPNGWGKVYWTEYKGTVNEFETKMVCPDCFAAVKNGSLPEYY